MNTKVSSFILLCGILISCANSRKSEQGLKPQEIIEQSKIYPEVVEVNEKNINMQYKLKYDGNYQLGSVDNYETIAGKVIGNITIPANGYESYVLDWKWVDSSNDAEVGFDVNSFYKLSIKVATK